MKRKRRTHLDRLLDEEENSYITTIDDCNQWFKILNKEIFEGALTPVDEIVISRRRGTYAVYECITTETNSVSKIYMNSSYRSKQFFVEVLCHEMVHHYQASHNEPLGHGPSFLRWRNKLNQKGLQLVRAYKK